MYVYMNDSNKLKLYLNIFLKNYLYCLFNYNSNRFELKLDFLMDLTKIEVLFNVFRLLNKLDQSMIFFFGMNSSLK